MIKTIFALTVLAIIIGGGAWYVFNRDAMAVAPMGAAEQQAASIVESYFTNSSPPPSPAPEAAAQTSAATEAVPAPVIKTNIQKIMHATLHTNHGDISIEFLD